MSFQKCFSKPVEYEYIQWTGDNLEEVKKFCERFVFNDEERKVYKFKAGFILEDDHETLCIAGSFDGSPLVTTEVSKGEYIVYKKDEIKRHDHVYCSSEKDFKEQYKIGDVATEQARNKFLDDILDKICDYQFCFCVDCYPSELLDSIYAIHKGHYFVFSATQNYANYGEREEWLCINSQEAFDNCVNKGGFSTYQELQDFMKDKQDVNGVFYDGVKLHDFKIDEKDLKRLDGED